MPKIFVGNLSFMTREQDIRPLFEAYGQVTACEVSTDNGSNRSKGFAFVEMPDPREAEKAIRDLSGYELHGRPLMIRKIIG